MELKNLTKKQLEREINTYENITAVGGNDVVYLNALWKEVDKRDYNITILPKKITLK